MTSNESTSADAPSKSETDTIGYADAVAELDDILAELDDDGIDIDILSDRVARAAHLIAICRGRIATAQNQVANIVENFDSSQDAQKE